MNRFIFSMIFLFLSCVSYAGDTLSPIKCKENSFYGRKIAGDYEKYGCYDCNDEDIFIFADIDECSKCSDRTLLVWNGPTPDYSMYFAHTGGTTPKEKVTGTCVTNKYLLEVKSEKEKK